MASVYLQLACLFVGFFFFVCLLACITALTYQARGGAAGDASLDAKKLKQRAERLFQDTRFKFERLEVRHILYRGRIRDHDMQAFWIGSGGG